jgi:hypothetical protein
VQNSIDIILSVELSVKGNFDTVDWSENLLNIFLFSFFLEFFPLTPYDIVWLKIAFALCLVCIRKAENFRFVGLKLFMLIRCENFSSRTDRRAVDKPGVS